MSNTITPTVFYRTILERQKIHPSKRPTEVPLDETGVEFDADKIIVSDVRDKVH